MKNRARRPARQLRTNIGPLTLVVLMIIAISITLTGKWDSLLSPLYR